MNSSFQRFSSAEWEEAIHVQKMYTVDTTTAGTAADCSVFDPAAITAKSRRSTQRSDTSHRGTL